MGNLCCENVYTITLTVNIMGSSWKNLQIPPVTKEYININTLFTREKTWISVKVKSVS